MFIGEEKDKEKHGLVSATRQQELLLVCARGAGCHMALEGGIVEWGEVPGKHKHYYFSMQYMGGGGRKMSSCLPTHFTFLNISPCCYANISAPPESLAPPATTILVSYRKYLLIYLPTLLLPTYLLTYLFTYLLVYLPTCLLTCLFITFLFITYLFITYLLIYLPTY